MHLYPALLPEGWPCFWTCDDDKYSLSFLLVLSGYNDVWAVPEDGVATKPWIRSDRKLWISPMPPTRDAL